MILCYYGLKQDIKGLILVGTLLYAAFTFPSFPIMMELIGKRVGKELELVATGNVAILTQVITAALLQIVASIISAPSKENSLLSFIIFGMCLLFNGLFGACAALRADTPFYKREGYAD